MNLFLIVCVAGGVGAVLRLLTGSAIPGKWRDRYPWGTTAANLIGSFLLGMVIGSPLLDGSWRAIIGTGLLGGYTTFSTASLETARLLTRERPFAALVNAFGMLIAAVAVALAGMAAGALLLP